MVRQLDCIAHRQLPLLREILINENVIRRCEWTALPIIEAAAHFVEAADVDTCDAFETTDAVNDNALREGDMRLLLDKRHKFFGHRGAAHANNRGTGRADQDVSADSSGSRLTRLDQATAQAHDRQDQRDL